MPEVVNAQAEIFLINGDMNSNLYTSSRAMHSAIIGLLQVPAFLESLCILESSSPALHPPHGCAAV